MTPEEDKGHQSANPSQQDEASADSLQEDRDDISQPRGQAFPIVAIGASAGGLEAFKQILENLPIDTGMAFVLVQHLDPHHPSQLTDLLARATRMEVRTVEDGLRVEPNKVYVIPENTTMVLEDGKLRLARRKPGLHFPIDSFFQSLAEVQGSRSVGVILSGNASDGSQGVRAIKSECGITFAQDEGTARHGGMPESAISTGAIDFILPPHEIARELAAVGRHPYVVPPKLSRPGDEELLPDGDGDLKKILIAVRNGTNVDFSHYKQNTIRRRIGRRMIVCRSKNLAEYAKFVSEHISEQRELYRDLLISVTNFFRDPEVFEALSRLLVIRLRDRTTHDPIRIWVPGCATGEEVYSLAICMHEALDQLNLSTSVQLFGTDISEIALNQARSGTYPDIIKDDVSPERLRRFFVRVGSGYQINKSIREGCIFARQDVAKDPPFGRTDLISCRNVLIYMNAALQRRVLPVLHYSLNPAGLLVLGTAESVALAPDLFMEIDKEHRIYGRKAVPVRLTVNLNIGRTAVTDAEEAAIAHPATGGADIQKKADRILQNKYAPPAVVVDSDLQILHFRGQTGPYLEPKPGEASLNLLRMAREEVVFPLRRMIEAAAKENASVREGGVVIEAQGERHEINIEVTPIEGSSLGERYYLVVFEDGAVRQNPNAASSAPLGDTGETENAADQESRVEQLQRQVAEFRAYVRNLAEDHEAHEEELHAANEEIRSANEELQSTNEELSTTKEEVQSANEELTTVNEELQNRNLELNAVNNDLNNLLTAINIVVMMVDNKLRIRRFNLAAEKTLELQAIDIGRHIGHLRGPSTIPELEESITRTLETLVSEQWEREGRNGRWYSVTVRPYRTSDDRIDGAVVVLVDITSLKQSLKAAEQARDSAEAMIETLREPLIVLDSDLRVVRATSAFYAAFQVSQSETLGRFIYDLGNGQWNDPKLRALLGGALFSDQPFYDYEIEHDFPHLGRRTFRLNARRIIRQEQDSPNLLLAIEDITKRQVEAEIRLLVASVQDYAVFQMDLGGRITTWNPGVERLLGYAEREFIGTLTADLYTPEDIAAGELEKELETARRTGRAEDERWHVRRDGSCFFASGVLTAIRDESGRLRGFAKIMRDITERQKAEEQIRSSLREKEILLKEVHHRVKNNLQVITSLLKLQSDFIRDPESLALFEEMYGRVRSIAAIHEGLYRSDSLARLDFGAYLQKVTQDQFVFYKVDPQKIRLRMNIRSAYLDISQAVPCGLIVNELITNALKHAFADGRPGVIQVSFEPSEGNFVLSIADNGIGLPPDINPQETVSMGLQLVTLLVDQLQATLTIDRAEGTRFSIAFSATGD